MSHICKLYLPREENQEVDSMRWLHMFKSIEIWEDEENHIPNGNRGVQPLHIQIFLVQSRLFNVSV